MIANYCAPSTPCCRPIRHYARPQQFAALVLPTRPWSDACERNSRRSRHYQQAPLNQRSRAVTRCKGQKRRRNDLARLEVGHDGRQRLKVGEHGPQRRGPGRDADLGCDPPPDRQRGLSVRRRRLLRRLPGLCLCLGCSGGRRRRGRGRKGGRGRRPGRGRRRREGRDDSGSVLLLLLLEFFFFLFVVIVYFFISRIGALEDADASRGERRAKGCYLFFFVRGRGSFGVRDKKSKRLCPHPLESLASPALSSAPLDSLAALILAREERTENAPSNPDNALGGGSVIEAGERRERSEGVGVGGRRRISSSAIPPTLSSRGAAAAFDLLLRRVRAAFLIEALDGKWGQCSLLSRCGQGVV